MDPQSKHFIFKEVSDKVFNHLKPYLIFFFFIISNGLFFIVNMLYCVVLKEKEYIMFV